MSKANVALYFTVLLISLALTITFGALWQNSDMFTVPGRINSVDYCQQHCFYNDHNDEICINSSALSLDWTFRNITYHQTGFVPGLLQCDDCCYKDVNDSIAVNINPDVPSRPIRFWFANQKPHSVVFEFLSVASSIVLFVFVGVGCMNLYTIIRRKSHQQL